MAALRFERRLVETRDGDTIAAALFRDGIRTFNRSLKSHRRRGLYCVTGDCANCLVTVDGVPGERACVTEVRDGMEVVRETGWPRTERDALAITDRLHWAMPVGFYYKVFVRPRWAWEVAERLIRRATGTGTLPRTSGTASKPTRYARVDVLVIGGGVAGLAAAASAEGLVLLVDEGAGRCGRSRCLVASRDRAPGNRGATPASRSWSATPRSASMRVRPCRWSVPTNSSRSRRRR
jgi:sarcosine oxidase subunit alpha